MADQEDAECVIKKLIEEYVGDHWAKTKTVCFLSSIGIYLKNSTAENRSVLSKGLREFLRQNPVVRVVKFPGVEQKIGAVPLSVSLPDDVRELFSKINVASDSQNRNIYLGEFWDAFIRPIADIPRYILIDEADLITVRDGPVDGGDGGDIKIFEILSQDLTTRILGWIYC